MKKIAIVVMVVAALVLAFAVPAFAGGNGALKADIHHISDNSDVIGFAIFNTNGNGGINVQVVVQDFEPGTYQLVVQAPTGSPREYDETIVIGENRKGTAHIQLDDLVVGQGDVTIECKVRMSESPRYETDHVFVPLK